MIQKLLLSVLSVLLPFIVVSDPCDPWGVRFSFGDYFMTGEGPQYTLSFNTNSTCEGFYLLIDNLRFNFTSNPLSYSGMNYSQPFLTNIHRTQIIRLIVNNSRILNFEYQIRLDYKNISYANTVRVVSRDAVHNYKALVIGDWGLLDDEHRKIYYDVFPCMEGSYNEEISIVFMLFLGDLGYQLSDREGEVYYNTLKGIEQFTSRIPFMVSPGNHDTKYSYELFQQTFTSPNSDNTSNYFYTFKIGQHLFLSYNPERDVYQENYPVRYSGKVYDIVEAYLEQNKKNIINLIPFSHYSIYCSDPNEIQCSNNAHTLDKYAELFQEHKVNIYLGAHIHVYERSYPMSKGLTGSFKNMSVNESYGIYENSSQVTYICEGAGGNNYFIYTTYYPLKDFTANRVINSGYGILELSSKNTNKLVYSHITAKDCSVSDHLEVTRTAESSIPMTRSNRVYVNILLGFLIFLVVAFIVVLIWRYVQRSKKGSESLIVNSVGSLSGSATSKTDKAAEKQTAEIKVQQFTQQL